VNPGVPGGARQNVPGAKMTHLVDALHRLGVHGEVALAGRWATIEGERCRVHVVEAPWGAGYYGWCDDPAERVVKRYVDPAAAIRDSLHRAAHGEGAEWSARTDRSDPCSKEND